MNKEFKETPISSKTLIKLINLYEKKGKEFYYNNLFSNDSKGIVNHYIQASCMSFSELFNHKINKTKLEKIIADSITPRNKEEQEFFNYIEVIKFIINNAHQIELSNAMIDEMIKKLNVKLNNKVSDNDDLFNRNLNNTLSNCIDEFKENIASAEIEYIFSASIFINHFYSNNFFNIDKDKAILIMILFLLITKFNTLKYSDLFSSIKIYHEDLKIALNNASYHYQKGVKYTTFVYDVLIDIVGNTLNNIETYSISYSLNKEYKKSDNLIRGILDKSSYFSISELMSEFPNISKTTIDRTLKQLKEEGCITLIRKGRSSLWQVTNTGKNKNRFEATLF